MKEEAKSSMPIIEAPVVVVEPSASKSKPAQVGDLNIAPKTTAEEDVATASQRIINYKWETTQQWVALLVTLTTLGVTAVLAISGKNVEAFMLLSNAFFLVVGTYFNRTNHTKTGGVEKRRGE